MAKRLSPSNEEFSSGSPEVQHGTQVNTDQAKTI